MGKPKQVKMNVETCWGGAGAGTLSVYTAYTLSANSPRVPLHNQNLCRGCFVKMTLETTIAPKITFCNSRVASDSTHRAVAKLCIAVEM